VRIRVIHVASALDREAGSPARGPGRSASRE
jgi:hypothetical protein